MRPMKREKGIAMIAALAMLVVVSGIALLMFARTIDEVRHSGDDAVIVQTLLLARGAANLGGTVLEGPVKEALSEIVTEESSTTDRWSFGGTPFDASSDAPDPADVATDLRAVAALLQDRIDAMTCGSPIAADVGGGTLELRIHVTETACGRSLPDDVRLPDGRFVTGAPRSGLGSAADQTYAIPFVLVAGGRIAEYARNVAVQGEYRFDVGRASFARYALFTNLHTTERGYDIWFTQNTLFDGPVHTNQYFRYYRDAWFGAPVTSASCRSPDRDACDWRGTREGAEFYGEGFVRSRNMRPDSANPSYTNRYGRQAPQLAGGVDWGAGFVPLPRNAQDQEAAARGEGIYFDDDLYSLTVWAADEAGDPLTGDAARSARYQYIRACESIGACATFRADAGGSLYELTDPDAGGWTLRQTGFNGVLYVEGDVARFTGPGREPASSSDPDDARPALASFSSMTLATAGDVRITGDLIYETPPCSGSPERNRDGSVTPATCDDMNVANVLGVYAQDGDVLIGNNNPGTDRDAPVDVTIHGVLMSSTGIVGVEDYDRGSPRGDVHLLGGAIEYYYGAFGMFSSRTGRNVSGYGRKFTYDQRMMRGVSPPYFPTVGDDQVRSVRLFSFGQREQVD